MRVDRKRFPVEARPGDRRSRPGEGGRVSSPSTGHGGPTVTQTGKRQPADNRDTAAMTARSAPTPRSPTARLPESIGLACRPAVNLTAVPSSKRVCSKRIVTLKTLGRDGPEVQKTVPVVPMSSSPGHTLESTCGPEGMKITRDSSRLPRPRLVPPSRGGPVDGVKLYPNDVYVGRNPKFGSTKWGNWHKVSNQATAEQCVARHLQELCTRTDLIHRLEELAGAATVPQDSLAMQTTSS